jgi:2-polyprenyl-6-methoxyphenol hydroxylase-like FAD-dependent oxidoreductase
MNHLANSSARHKISYIEDEVASFTKTTENCLVALKNNPNQIEAKLLIGSDGIASNIKRLAGIPHYGWQYRQRAIVCTMAIDPQHLNISAFQIYHDGNVLAILPLWDNYVSLVWSLGLPDF